MSRKDERWKTTAGARTGYRKVRLDERDTRKSKMRGKHSEIWLTGYEEEGLGGGGGCQANTTPSLVCFRLVQLSHLHLFLTDACPSILPITPPGKEKKTKKGLMASIWLTG